MVKVEIGRQENYIISFHVYGHANTAAYGKDLVCAGISTLVQSVIYTLSEYLKCEIEYQIKSGNTSLKLVSKPNSETEAVLQTLFNGLVGIQEIYPKNLKISEK